MVDKDVPQNRQLRINGCNFTEIGPEWSPEALKGSWRVEFRDFIADLTADKLAFKVYRRRDDTVSTNAGIPPRHSPVIKER